MGTPIRLFVISAAVAIRYALARQLDAEPGFTVVGEARTSRQALVRVPAIRPDLVLAGAHLEDPSSPEMIRLLRAQLPDLHVLMMGVFASAELIRAAMRAGAAGVLPHTVGWQELVHGLEEAANGRVVMSTHVLHDALADPSVSDTLGRLSGRDRMLFGLVGEGLSNAEIGERLHLSEGTVRNYVSRLLRLLQLQRRSQIVAMATQLKAAQQPIVMP